MSCLSIGYIGDRRAKSEAYHKGQETDRDSDDKTYWLAPVKQIPARGTGHCAQTPPYSISFASILTSRPPLYIHLRPFPQSRVPRKQAAKIQTTPSHPHEPLAGNRKQNVEVHSQVVATSSIASFNRAEPGGFAYGSSKAAVTHLMKSCATILSPYGIRFNVIAPGRSFPQCLCLPVLMRVTVYPSELTQDYGPFHSSVHPDQEGSMPSHEVPAKRAGSPKDMAGNILYLASPAGAYVKGMVLITDGGRLSICPAT